jgi:hypothetical protein
MSSLPASSPSANPIRHRRPLQPVQVLAVRCDASIGDLIAGHAVLSIARGDHTDLDVRLYWVKAHLDPDGRVTGFELSKFGTGQRYDLPADLSSCDCPDRVYREERPGGCRHMQALRQALVAVASGITPVTPEPAEEERIDQGAFAAGRRAG